MHRPLQKAKFSRLPHALLAKEPELLLQQTDGRTDELADTVALFSLKPLFLENIKQNM